MLKGHFHFLQESADPLNPFELYSWATASEEKRRSCVGFRAVGEEGWVLGFFLQDGFWLKVCARAFSITVTLCPLEGGVLGSSCIHVRVSDVLYATRSLPGSMRNQTEH